MRKWKYRETIADWSHKPHRLHTALSPAQEAIVVELRRSLLLSTDDPLVVVREFIQPDLNRSTLQRLLVRHGVSDRRALIPQPEGEAKPKTVKDDQPGYVHVDIKYLPAMADEDSRTYLFVAIDRASRWVYLERHREKSQRAATRFLKNLHEKACFVCASCSRTTTRLSRIDSARRAGSPRGTTSSTSSARSAASSTGSRRRAIPRPTG